MIRDLLRVGLAAAAGIALVTAYATFRIWDQGGHDEQRPAGAIVCSGRLSTTERHRPSRRAARPRCLALLAGLAPYVVATGGKLDGDR
jgi:hypothetical protein